MELNHVCDCVFIVSSEIDFTHGGNCIREIGNIGDITLMVIDRNIGNTD